jgi:hypothetical protein
VLPRRRSASAASYCRVVALLAQGWFDWSRYGAVMVGSAVGILGVVLAGALLLWRSRPHCQFGPPKVEVFMGTHLKFGSRPLTTSLVPRLRITIPIRIVPGDGGWVVERFAVTFVSNGKILDATRHTPLPEMSAKQFQTPLVYVMEYPDAEALVIGARIEFRHGGRAKLRRTTVPVPRLSQ